MVGTFLLESLGRFHSLEPPGTQAFSPVTAAGINPEVKVTDAALASDQSTVPSQNALEAKRQESRKRSLYGVCPLQLPPTTVSI